jgi:Ca-activated chloride channel family protein
MRDTRLIRRRGMILVATGVVVAAGLVGTQGSAYGARGDNLALSTRSSQAALRISGTVRQVGNNIPIQGANVAVSVDGVKRTTGATSDVDGRYVVELDRVASGSAVVVTIRRLGFTPQETKFIASTPAHVVDASLSPSATTLASVVVTQDASATRVRESASAQTVSAAPPATQSVPKTIAGGRAMAMPGGALNSVGQAAELRRDRRERAGDDIRDTERDPARMVGDREQYDRIRDNPFLAVSGNPRSTFSVDVDRASYGNIRRFLTQGQLPPADAVRIEEMVNYFPYRLAEPRGDAPVAITTEAMPAPWQPRHHLVRVALQARRLATDRLPPSNLVFLIDVSGSMSSPDKLPLVKQSLRLLVEQLREQDRVALVVYAGAAGLVLPSTSGDQKATIMAAIDRLESGGSTAGGAGLELAYRTAREHFTRGSNNRVILATDGDFNVGPSSDAAMERLVESKRAEGTYLTILGFGTGNYQDAKMQKLARVGNGNAAYVDDLAEARKVLVTEMGGTLVTVANDVKLQVEFNPARVASYRLIGYEDRILRDEDFRDDKKDAGDMGAGHSVTALYEVVPVGVRGTVKVRSSDPLRYQADDELPRLRETERVSGNDELLHVSLRYKTPGESTSKLMTKALTMRSVREDASDDLRFAAAVASFGMLLRDSEYKGNATASSVLSWARGTEDDEEGYRSEFVGLVERWRTLSRNVANRPGERER